MNDIDLSGIEWTEKTLCLGAEFNGNGYTIDNLTSTRGLFVGNDGIIKNLNMTNAEINGGSAIGILVGANYAKAVIENCSVSGSVTSSYRDGGGLAGSNYGTIKNSSANVDVAGVYYVGGLAGYNYDGATIQNSNATGSVTATNRMAGGLVGQNQGTITNASASGYVSGLNQIGGLVGNNNGANAKIENASATGDVTATGNSSGGLVGYNQGTITNANASGNVNGAGTVGGLVGYNNVNAKIENASATGDVTATDNHSGGLVGSNTGTITNANASGNVNGAGTVGGLAGSCNGVNSKIENSSATGDVTSTGIYIGGLVGSAANGTIINNSYALGNIDAKSHTGGLVGVLGSNTVITNSYTKSDINAQAGSIGGLIGYVGGINAVVSNSYATGDITNNQASAGFVGTVASGASIDISDSYTTSTVEKGNAFINQGINNATLTNVYANSDQPAGVLVEQAGVTAMPKDWFEDSENLQFLGDAYDYYYNPPEIKGNSESYASEFIKFQIGANEGKDNMLSLNLTFKMNFFSADVSSIEKASATLEKVDEFKQTLTEKRSEIGAARNRLESVIESQSVRLENLEASHSTMVDTDFAFEAANLTKMQILQNTTATLLAQANTLPSLALQLLE